MKQMEPFSPRRSDSIHQNISPRFFSDSRRFIASGLTSSTTAVYDVKSLAVLASFETPPHCDAADVWDGQFIALTAGDSNAPSTYLYEHVGRESRLGVLGMPPCWCLIVCFLFLLASLLRDAFRVRHSLQCLRPHHHRLPISPPSRNHPRPSPPHHRRPRSPSPHRPHPRPPLPPMRSEPSAPLTFLATCYRPCLRPNSPPPRPRAQGLHPFIHLAGQHPLRLFRPHFPRSAPDPRRPIRLLAPGPVHLNRPRRTPLGELNRAVGDAVHRCRNSHRLTQSSLLRHDIRPLRRYTPPSK